MDGLYQDSLYWEDCRIRYVKYWLENLCIRNPSPVPDSAEEYPSCEDYGNCTFSSTPDTIDTSSPALVLNSTKGYPSCKDYDNCAFNSTRDSIDTSSPALAFNSAQDYPNIYGRSTVSKDAIEVIKDPFSLDLPCEVKKDVCIIGQPNDEWFDNSVQTYKDARQTGSIKYKNLRPSGFHLKPEPSSSNLKFEPSNSNQKSIRPSNFSKFPSSSLQSEVTNSIPKPVPSESNLKSEPASFSSKYTSFYPESEYSSSNLRSNPKSELSSCYPKSVFLRDSLKAVNARANEFLQQKIELFQFFLEDAIGVCMFEQFLKENNYETINLQFLIACRRFQKSHHSQKFPQVIRYIYKEQVKKISVIPTFIKHEIKQKLHSKIGLDIHIFDKAQKEVEKCMLKIFFLEFLNSHFLPMNLLKNKDLLASP